MSLLSSLFGGSSTKSTQKQTQDSFGYSLNRSNAASTSGGYSTGASSGISGSSSSVFADDLVRQLYSGALGAADAINPELATSRVNQLFTGGANIIAQLEGGGAGEDYLTRRLSGSDTSILDAQIGALGKDLGKFFNEELNPVIRGSAVAGGALGGGRQGVAEGLASQGVLEQFAAGAANLRATDLTNRDNAALGLISGRNTAAQTALSGLPALAGLGSGTESLSPYLALGQIFGSPTVLSQSFGQEQSMQQSEEFAQSLAEELGISYDEAHAILEASSKGKSSDGIFGAIKFPFGG